MANAWIEFVKEFRKKNPNMDYKKVLQEAKKVYVPIGKKPTKSKAKGKSIVDLDKQQKDIIERQLIRDKAFDVARQDKEKEGNIKKKKEEELKRLKNTRKITKKSNPIREGQLNKEIAQLSGGDLLSGVGTPLVDNDLFGGVLNVNDRKRLLREYKKLKSNVDKALKEGNMTQSLFKEYLNIAKKLMGKSKTNAYAKHIKKVEKSLKSKGYDNKNKSNRKKDAKELVKKQGKDNLERQLELDEIRQKGIETQSKKIKPLENLLELWKRDGHSVKEFNEIKLKFGDDFGLFKKEINRELAKRKKFKTSPTLGSNKSGQNFGSFIKKYKKLSYTNFKNLYRDFFDLTHKDAEKEISKNNDYNTYKDSGVFGDEAFDTKEYNAEKKRIVAERKKQKEEDNKKPKKTDADKDVDKKNDKERQNRDATNSEAYQKFLAVFGQLKGRISKENIHQLFPSTKQLQVGLKTLSDVYKNISNYGELDRDFIINVKKVYDEALGDSSKANNPQKTNVLVRDTNGNIVDSNMSNPNDQNSVVVRTRDRDGNIGSGRMINRQDANMAYQYGNFFENRRSNDRNIFGVDNETHSKIMEFYKNLLQETQSGQIDNNEAVALIQSTIESGRLPIDSQRPSLTIEGSQQGTQNKLNQNDILFLTSKLKNILTMNPQAKPKVIGEVDGSRIAEGINLQNEFENQSLLDQGILQQTNTTSNLPNILQARKEDNIHAIKEIINKIPSLPFNDSDKAFLKNTLETQQLNENDAPRLYNIMSSLGLTNENVNELFTTLHKETVNSINAPNNVRILDAPNNQTALAVNKDTNDFSDEEEEPNPFIAIKEAQAQPQSQSVGEQEQLPIQEDEPIDFLPAFKNKYPDYNPKVHRKPTEDEINPPTTVNDILDSSIKKSNKGRKKGGANKYKAELSQRLHNFKVERKNDTGNQSYFMGAVGQGELNDKKKEIKDELKSKGATDEDLGGSLLEGGSIWGTILMAMGAKKLITKGINMVQSSRGKDDKSQENIDSQDVKYFDASKDVYNAVKDRPSIGSYNISSSISDAETSVYIDEYDKKIIMAFRGTANFKDAKGTWGKIAFNSLENSKRFRSDLEKNNFIHKSLPNYKVTYTGHSLGGSIAVAMVKNFPQDNAVIFNAGFGVGYNVKNLNVKSYSVKGDGVSALGAGQYKDNIIITGDASNPLDAHGISAFKEGRGGALIITHNNKDEIKQKTRRLKDDIHALPNLQPNDYNSVKQNIVNHYNSLNRETQGYNYQSGGHELREEIEELGKRLHYIIRKYEPIHNYQSIRSVGGGSLPLFEPSDKSKNSLVYKLLKWGSKKLLGKLRGGDLSQLDNEDHKEYKQITGKYVNEN